MRHARPPPLSLCPAFPVLLPPVSWLTRCVPSGPHGSACTPPASTILCSHSAAATRVSVVVPQHWAKPQGRAFVLRLEALPRVDSLLASSRISFNACPNVTPSLRPSLHPPTPTPRIPGSPRPVLVFLLLLNILYHLLLVFVSLPG